MMFLHRNGLQGSVTRHYGLMGFHRVCRKEGFKSEICYVADKASIFLRNVVNNTSFHNTSKRLSRIRTNKKIGSLKLVINFTLIFVHIAQPCELYFTIICSVDILIYQFYTCCVIAWLMARFIAIWPSCVYTCEDGGKSPKLNGVQYNIAVPIKEPYLYNLL
jgi:hypothetical protein